MEKTSYHHGALKEALIEAGIQMINEEGIENFSMRKVAIRCNVSHTAPYKHFKNKEALIDEMMEYVMKDFTNEIIRVAKENPGQRCVLEIGKRYVTYMLEHKDYFNLLFMGEKKGIVKIEGNAFSYEEGHPFGAFAEVATDFIKDSILDERVRNNMILHCWSTVHGLAHLIISGMVQYQGDYAQLTEEMLHVICIK